MSKKKCYNYQPNDDTRIVFGEVHKEKFIERLKRYPKAVLEYIWINEECQVIFGHDIQLPITGNVYAFYTQEMRVSWVKAILELEFYIEQQFNTRLFCVPLANAVFVATDAPIETVKDTCSEVLYMNGYGIEF